jgi:hypothetical protein
MGLAATDYWDDARARSRKKNVQMARSHQMRARQAAEAAMKKKEKQRQRCESAMQRRLFSRGTSQLSSALASSYAAATRAALFPSSTSSAAPASSADLLSEPEPLVAWVMHVASRERLSSRVLSVAPITAASAGVPLRERFMAACRHAAAARAPSHGGRAGAGAGGARGGGLVVKLVFHGTALEHISSICQDGFATASAGSAFFGTTINKAASYVTFGQPPKGQP